MTYKKNPVTGKSLRGFAAMDKEKLAKIAASGGASVPAHKRSFARNLTLASEAGAKGGSTSRGGGRPKK